MNWLTSYLEFFLVNYGSLSRFEVIWEMPLSVGLRIQQAYLARHSEPDEKAQFNTDRYSFHYHRIIKEFLGDRL